MVFQTEPHIERAHEHIDSGNSDRLAYACLELRYALERIAYQKLQLRLDKITIEEIGAWQPRRAIFDERAATSSSYSDRFCSQATSGDFRIPFLPGGSRRLIQLA